MRKWISTKLLFVSGMLLALVIVMTACASTPPVSVSRPVKPGRWAPTGLPGGGVITSNQFAADGSMFVTTDVGSVWRSRNGGISWQIVTSGIESFYCSGIVCHPYDHTILLLGTAGGIYKSVDGGDSWAARREGFSALQENTLSAPIGSIAFDESDPDIVYCSTGYHPLYDNPANLKGNGTMYRSDDGGDSWRKLTSYPKGGYCATFSIYAKAGRVLAATNIGLFESRDGGNSWVKMEGLPLDVVLDVIVHPKDPELLHVSLQNPSGHTPWKGGIWMSEDGGKTWSNASTGLESHVGDVFAGYLATSMYFEIVRDPFNTERLMTVNVSWGTGAVYISQNGGKSWKNVTENVPPNKTGWLGFSGLVMAPIVFHPEIPDTIYYGGPLMKSTNGGKTWFQDYCREIPPGSGFWQAVGPNVTCMYDVTFDSFDAKKIYSGFWDVGFLRSINGGDTWRRSTAGLIHEGNVFHIQPDPVTPDMIWASSGRWEFDAGNMAVSRNGGEDWKIIGTVENGLPDTPIYDFVVAAQPEKTRRIIALSYGAGLRLSDDDGATWQPILDSAGAPPFRYGYAVAADPKNPVILFAGDDSGNTSHRIPEKTYVGGVWKSIDGGDSWEKLDVEAVCVKDIVISPHDSNVILIATRDGWDQVLPAFRGGGIHVSRDGGETWVKTYDARYAQVVKADPTIPGRFYVGITDNAYHDREAVEGILRSDDWGVTWEPYNDGLGIPKVVAIAIDPTDSEHLFAGTPGAGLFQIHGISAMK